MNTLTPSEQEIVNEAAKLEASFQCHHEDRIYAGQICFHAGVEFALQEMVKGRMIKFVEWCGDNYFHDDANNWQDRWNGEHFTTEQLYDKYQEHLKQQEV